jgi:signal transduction histidine kinase
MKPKRVFAGYTPIFLKMIAIFFGAALFLLATVVALVGPPWSPHPDQRMRNGMFFQLGAMADQMGNPPSLEKARDLSHDLGPDIRVEGPGVLIDTADLGSIDAHLSGPMVQRYPDGRWEGHGYGQDYFIFRRGPYRYLFQYRGHLPFARDPWKAAALLGMVVLVLGASYLTVTWVLRPMDLLVNGVEEISAGHLDYRIRTRTRDEFHGLAEAFNTMAESIDAMIKAKGRLLVDISHELRSPLTRVNVALAMLPDSDEQRSIAHDVAEMERMVTELLEAEKMKSPFGALDLEDLDLVACARETAFLFRSRAPGLRLDEPPTFPRLRLDAARLRTVLVNLLENALKYSQEQALPVEITFWHDADGAGLRVRDHGIGIPDAELELIFEPFYRTDQSRDKRTGGYGLGLSLCREIVSAHGGNLRLSNHPGGGTQAELWLPRPRNA